MLIGELAARTGVSVATVRYYERRGLLPEPPRSPAGYRQYGGDAPARIRFIKHAQRLGFSLAEIGELLALRVEHESACAAVRSRAQAKVAHVRGQIRELSRMQEVLEGLIASCDNRERTSECPILAVLEEDERD